MKKVPLWHYRMTDFGKTLCNIRNITQHQRSLCLVDGEKIRIRLDNRYNAGSMKIGRICVGVESAEGICKSPVPVTVGDSESVILHPGETVFTDEIPVDVCRGNWLHVWIYFEKASGIRALCQTWSAKTWQSWFYEGNTSGQMLLKDAEKCTKLFSYLADDIHEPNAVLGVSHIEIFCADDVKTAVLFGDSITHMSYYYDPLCLRVLKECGGKLALANVGIGGNRLCYDYPDMPDLFGNGRQFGPAGYKRFGDDTWEEMEPDAVVFLEGINDCWQGYGYDRKDEYLRPELYRERLTEVMEEAHRRGSRIYVGTVIPSDTFNEESWYNEAEKLRQEINSYIREQKTADGIIDFDTAARKSDMPDSLKEGFDMGDGLHPGDMGGKIMADMVPLEILCAVGL